MHAHDDEHRHVHAHDHDYDNSTYKDLIIAFILNFGFAIIELVGGLISGSIMLTADSVHDFGDSISIIIALVFKRISLKKQNNYYNYGYNRFSTFGALITALFLIISSVFILYETAIRLLNPVVVTPGIVVVIGIFGIIINGLSILRLKRTNDILNRTVLLHLLEDFLGWILALIGAIFIYFFGIYRIDTILAIILAIFILYRAIKKCAEVTKIFLQGVPRGLVYENVCNAIKSVDGVNDVNDVKIWSLDGNKHVLTCVIDLDISKSKELIKQVKNELLKYDIAYTTIEVLYD